MDYRNRFVAMTLALGLLALAGCGGIRVRPVTYTLPEIILAPMNAPAVTDKSAGFADVFCAVMEQGRPDGDSYGECGQYFDPPAENPVLPPMPTRYHLLIVPGIFNTCASSAVEAFSFARLHLEETHGMKVHYLSITDDSSKVNGGKIAEYIRGINLGTGEGIIAVGYSKGAADLQESLAHNPELKNKVKALVTVAGTVGGTRLADLLPKEVWARMGKLKFKDCEFNAAALDSMSREERQQFLHKFPHPVVRSYSVVAVSTREHTSRILRGTWKRLSAYEAEQDSQVIKYEGIVPGGTFLGKALRDHWAVAMPFERAPDSLFKKLVDQNHFPRAALLEAIVRFVARDLEDSTP